MSRQNIHRRKSSKDQDENVIVLPSSPPDPALTDKTSPTITINGENVPEPPTFIGAPPPPRMRVHSSPQHSSHSRSASTSHIVNGDPAHFPISAGGAPPSAGPFRTNFSMPPPPPVNGASAHPTSPFRTSFATPLSPHQSIGGHSRTRSISTPFTPASPSPLASSFAAGSGGLKSPTFTFPAERPDAANNALISSSPPSTRRHNRLHSRNLSVFFPRPGSLPASSIAEDGDDDDGQEIEVPRDIEPVPIPSSSPNIDFPRRANSSPHQPPTPLGQGFTFGARPPTMSDVSHELLTGPRAKRRGHHHKHSLSHNLFSFLDPGSAGPYSASSTGSGEEMHTQPTPTPVSPWAPISAFPESAAPTKGDFAQAQVQAQIQQANGHMQRAHIPDTIPLNAAAVTIAEFFLGAWLWVCGQQIGSLSVTGLGYWIVFDSFGVGFSKVLPSYLARRARSFGEREKERMKRFYGNSRVETVFLFAQSVYLMFSSVYVCKETIEHLLLSADSGEGHHHHHGDEQGDLPIDFPTIMIFFTLLYVLATAVVYNNHLTLVNVSGNRIPSFRTMYRSLTSSSRHAHLDSPPTTPLLQALSNPFVASPLAFCAILLITALSVPAVHHRLADLMLAGLIAVVTFNVAYRACAVVGTVLLQTSPSRGMQSGKMEAFLRAMREVERHPQVLHLPAPHIWQLTPSSTESASGQSESLVVTMQLHVREDLGDDDVLKLTRWAWERCVGALGAGVMSESGDGVPEVTVGVIRG